MSVTESNYYSERGGMSSRAYLAEAKFLIVYSMAAFKLKA